MQMIATKTEGSNLPDTDPARRAPATPQDWIGKTLIGVTSLAWFATCVIAAIEAGEPVQSESFTAGMLAVALTILSVAVKILRVLTGMMTEVGRSRRREWWAGYRASAVSFQRAESAADDEDQRVY